jgi:protoporphyrinogen oxidase
MDVSHVSHLVVGAGMSGLSFASAIRAEAKKRNRSEPSVVVLEADSEPGGYCKTITKDGFVWDYSGHFFHFKHREIEEWLRARMPADEVKTVEKVSLIRFKGLDIDFPFQKNIHQLPREDFVDCLHDLYFRDRDAQPKSFYEMLFARFGRGIAERFLIPYNEKLYACDLRGLDVDAMGRFFPHADIADIIRNMKVADNASYNSSFTYPRGGAIQYVRAFLSDLPGDAVAYREALVGIDLGRRVARTNQREIRYDKLVSSAPLDKLVRMTGIPFDEKAFTYNRVLVFNLGFDKKGPRKVHWMYFPDKSLAFYRVGFYDNIFDSDRMSLYVEIGCPKEGPIDVDAMRARVLADLAREKIIDGHKLIAEHHVVMDPAYVHITKSSLAEVARLKPILAAGGVYPVGRYGGWTYCSIEDNIVETRALAGVLGELL